MFNLRTVAEISDEYKPFSDDDTGKPENINVSTCKPRKKPEK
jgi:hypothetical protein